jgi:hypothetical protein
MGPQFLSLVEEVWKVPVEGSPMFQLCTKLKKLKPVLKKLNAECYSDISKRVEEARKRMKEVQCELQQYPNSVEMVRSEAEAVRVYTTLRRDEESFFKQKSRVQWLNLWDQNTKFFFKAVVQ